MLALGQSVVPKRFCTELCFDVLIRFQGPRDSKADTGANFVLLVNVSKPESITVTDKSHQIVKLITRASSSARNKIFKKARVKINETDELRCLERPTYSGNVSSFAVHRQSRRTERNARKCQLCRTVLNDRVNGVGLRAIWGY